MKRLIGICAVVLLVQTGLVVLTNLSRNPGESQSGTGPLFPFTATQVNEVLLEDGEGQHLLLKKEQDTWQLPESASFPADTVRVQGLVDRLVGQQRGWPEATTAEAAKRFKVASDRFERKLTLRTNTTPLGVVYFGSSPALRQIYVRLEGKPEIQVLAMSQHELEVRADSWIDTRLLHLKPEQVVRVELPGLKLDRQKEGLAPADLAADEEIIREKRDGLVKRLASLSISALLGAENTPGYGLENPTLRYSLELEGGSRIEYVFGRPPSSTGSKEAPQQLPEPPSYVLKVSARDQLFRVDGWQVDEIRNATRASLVHRKGQGERGEEQIKPPAAATGLPQ